MFLFSPAPTVTVTATVLGENHISKPDFVWHHFEKRERWCNVRYVQFHEGEELACVVAVVLFLPIAALLGWLGVLALDLGWGGDGCLLGRGLCSACLGAVVGKAVGHGNRVCKHGGERWCAARHRIRCSGGGRCEGRWLGE